MHEEVDELGQADEAAAGLAHTVDAALHDVIDVSETFYDLAWQLVAVPLNKQMEHSADPEKLLNLLTHIIELVYNTRRGVAQLVRH